MISSDVLQSAKRLHNFLRRTGEGNVILLEGDSRLDLVGLRFVPSRWDGPFDFEVGIEYKGKSRASATRRLSFHKRWVATFNDAAITRLHGLLQDIGLTMRIKMAVSPIRGQAWLAVPSRQDLRDIERILRINRRWPSVDDLAEQLAAEHECERLKALPGAVEVIFKGTRNRPPQFLQDRGFWHGQCYINLLWPEPGSRRKPVVTLATMTHEPLVSCKPGSALYTPLHQLFLAQKCEHRLMHAAAVMALSGEDRKPRTVLRFA